MLELVSLIDQSIPAFDAVDTLVGWGAVFRAPRAPRPLRTEIHERHVREELVAPWRDLAVRAENPFVTPDWHAAWQRLPDGGRARVRRALGR